MTTTNPLRIGLFGGGIVGGGTYELIQRCIASGRFAAVGASMEICKICVRSLSKPRDFEVKPGTTLVTDYEAILGDASINVVIELMGGTTHAKDVVFGAIAAICIIYSGVLFLTASGDVGKIKTARAALLWGIVGIVVGFFAYVSIAFFGNLLS